VLSGRGLCDGPIIRAGDPSEYAVSDCDRENSQGRLGPLGLLSHERRKQSHVTGVPEHCVCSKTTVSFRETEETEGKVGGRSSVG